MSEDIQELTEDAKTIRNAILAYMDKLDYVSFAELQHNLNRHYDGDIPSLEGDRAITAPGRPNTIIWASMSRDFVAAVLSLVDEKKVFFHSTQYLVYLVDGTALTFPIAKRPHPTRDYKKPHWLVTCLRRVPHIPKDHSEKGKAP